jgi:hypothetical protein
MESRFFYIACLIIAACPQWGPAFYKDESEDSVLIVDGVFAENFRLIFLGSRLAEINPLGNPEEITIV